MNKEIRERLNEIAEAYNRTKGCLGGTISKRNQRHRELEGLPKWPICYIVMKRRLRERLGQAEKDIPILRAELKILEKEYRELIG